MLLWPGFSSFVAIVMNFVFGFPLYSLAFYVSQANLVKVLLLFMNVSFTYLVVFLEAFDCLPTYSLYFQN